MDYLVRFIGHINEKSRPDGFPKEVYSDLYVRAGSDAGLRKAINEQSMVFIRDNCMIVPKNPEKIEDAFRPSLDSRMIIPWHMITHLTTVTKPIVGGLPELNRDGGDEGLEFSDGTERIQ